MVLSTVASRLLFYNDSSFDGNDPAANAADDAAIAPDKSAYSAGSGAATFSNVSGYDKGINGVMVDLTAGGNHAAITAADFSFKVGNNDTPGSWSAAPAPASVAVRTGAGAGGSDRVSITWANNVKGQWLEVEVLATANTGLASADVFYFGSAPGESGTGNSPTGMPVNATDEIGARNNPHNFGNPATIGDDFDYNRDTFVNATDQIISRNNSTNFSTQLSVIDVVGVAPPALSAALANDTGPGGVPNSDGITQDPEVDGTLTTTDTITDFVAGLNAGPLTTDVLPLVGPGGAFTISEALMETMNGGPLPDGPHVLHLRADDSLGQMTFFDVPFTLKRSIATPSLPDLTSGSDSGASSVDNITNDNTPTIEVIAENGSMVTLYVDASPVQTQLAGPVAVFTLATLGDGVKSITATAEDGAGNVSSTSSALPITIHTASPTVSVETLLTFTDDLTPHVTVSASSGLGLANGTEVRLDVDVDNNGNFLGANESNRTQSTLFNGGSYFEVDPALPSTNPIDGPYLVQLRARVTDIAGNEGVSPLSSLSIDNLTNTILSDYVHAVDPTTSVGATPASTIAGPGFTVYVFDLKSQTWRSAADVNKPLWQHWLQIIVPSTVSHSTALMLIDGGSNSASAPTSLTGDMFAVGSIAAAREMIGVILPTVPNQPLEFTDEVNNPRTEDEIIAYTFDKYVNNQGQPGNDTWPLLLPMVKSAVEAMNAVQARDTTLPGGVDVTDFIVSGYSKRGWTTWLTGAVDSRVTSIVPGVIDLLNMDESMVHHYNFYGFFAPHVGDYQDFNLIENIAMPANTDLGRIVDPYSYLFNSNLTTMKKFLINSPGDEFFVPDSGQFYMSDLPGPSYVRYIPNTGHGLNDTEVINSSNSWADAILFNRTLPNYSWTVDQDGGIRMTTVTAPTTVKLWQATNSSTRDFRNGFTGLTWTSSVLADQGGGVYLGNVPVPGTGATAYFVEMTYPSFLAGNPYIFTTEVRVQSNIPLNPWPFFMPTNDSDDGDVAAPTVASDDQNDLAFGLGAPAAPVVAKSSTSGDATAAPATVAPAVTVRDAATAALFDDWSWTDAVLDSPEDADDELESVLAGLDEPL